MDRKTKYPENSPLSQPSELQEVMAPSVTSARESGMVRTQIYLTRGEYDFLQAESRKRDEPMAAVIRTFIDEKMTVPEDAWRDNSLLQPPKPDPAWQGREDGALNHDHYVYGTPKKWMKREGKWVETPPLPDDYYTNPTSRRTYDEAVNHGE